MMKKNIVNNINAKLEDLALEREDTKNSVALSENTKHTKLNKLSREIRNLMFINTLLDLIDDGVDIVLKGDVVEYYNTLVRLSADKAAYVARGTVEVHEGDVLMDLLKKYIEVKDVYSKIMKACAAEGLVLGADGVIHKA